MNLSDTISYSSPQMMPISELRECVHGRREQQGTHRGPHRREWARSSARPPNRPSPPSHRPARTSRGWGKQKCNVKSVYQFVTFENSKQTLTSN